MVKLRCIYLKKTIYGVLEFHRLKVLPKHLFIVTSINYDNCEFKNVGIQGWRALRQLFRVVIVTAGRFEGYNNNSLL